ncbi:hypothetical protein MSAS_05110 [Mycobacterium saskatchewanense]|nr:hypothetical protein MSAS_05110 [Mycobacterium saskatchewanense]
MAIPPDRRHTITPARAEPCRIVITGMILPQKRTAMANSREIDRISAAVAQQGGNGRCHPVKATVTQVPPK